MSVLFEMFEPTNRRMPLIGRLPSQRDSPMSAQANGRSWRIAVLLGLWIANSQDFAAYFVRKLEEIEFRSYDATFTAPKVVGRTRFGTLNFP